MSSLALTAVVHETDGASAPELEAVQYHIPASAVALLGLPGTAVHEAQRESEMEGEVTATCHSADTTRMSPDATLPANALEHVVAAEQAAKVFWMRPGAPTLEDPSSEGVAVCALEVS